MGIEIEQQRSKSQEEILQNNLGIFNYAIKTLTRLTTTWSIHTILSSCHKHDIELRHN